MSYLFSVMFIIFGIVSVFTADSIYTVAALFGVAALFNIAGAIQYKRRTSSDDT